MDFKKILLQVLVTSLLIAGCATPMAFKAKKEIHDLNALMEQFFRNNQPLKLAALYSDDAILIGPNNYKIEGRENVDNYWKKFGNPIDWELTVLEVDRSLLKLKQSDTYLQWKNKPPTWKQALPLRRDDSTIYQLGHSKITYERDGKRHTSDVDFLIVWRKKKNASEYRILVDSYVHN